MNTILKKQQLIYRQYLQFSLNCCNIHNNNNNNKLFVQAFLYLIQIEKNVLLFFGGLEDNAKLKNTTASTYISLAAMTLVMQIKTKVKECLKEVTASEKQWIIEENERIGIAAMKKDIEKIFDGVDMKNLQAELMTLSLSFLRYIMIKYFKLFKVLQVYSHYAQTIQFSSDGTKVVSSFADATVCVSHASLKHKTTQQNIQLLYRVYSAKCKIILQKKFFVYKTNKNIVMIIDEMIIKKKVIHQFQIVFSNIFENKELEATLVSTNLYPYFFLCFGLFILLKIISRINNFYNKNIAIFILTMDIILNIKKR
ncbi:hypothetical protein RFI_20766 [Reticulomyxa filosa]|uniref:Transmembrane protein n=1 Tax=Reticulomyxa filosa TaxID=46433 RepID=X6MSB6_RETFI|nr:hypothetical protein RFI_20766 [Reticulomyxa filosa]|eukprot:ETO16571.1 hypothetical protein RFI_20766 [Reticulomyxa filosa]